MYSGRNARSVSVKCDGRCFSGFDSFNDISKFNETSLCPLFSLPEITEYIDLKRVTMLCMNMTDNKKVRGTEKKILAKVQFEQSLLIRV